MTRRRDPSGADRTRRPEPPAGDHADPSDDTHDPGERSAGTGDSRLPSDHDGEPVNEPKPSEEEVLDPADAPSSGPAEEEAQDDAPLYQDRWLRAEAELQNFRRRSAKEREETRRYAEEAVLLDLITILDDLERALDAARASGAEDAWLDGVELVAARMRDTLARRGVEPVDPVGKPFDPVHHEALLEVPAPEGMKPGDVAQVVLKDYRREARSLRVARVAVARAREDGDG
jgi:molecular chaperone GrpE